MTNKKRILGVVIMFCLVGSLIGFGSAVECDSSLSQLSLYTNCTVSNSLQLNNSLVIYSNGSVLGAIKINANNVLLNLNNSLLIGNNSLNNYGITSGGRTNFTIINGNLKNYYTGIYLTSNYNSSITNFTINNSLYYAIDYQDATNNNLTIKNLVVNNASGIRVRGFKLNIFNSKFNINVSGIGLNCALSCDNLYVSNVTFNGGDKGIYLVQAQNPNITSSYFNNQTLDGIDMTSSTTGTVNFSVSSSFFTNSLRYGVNIHGNAINPYVYANSFQNMTAVFSNSNNTIIDGNIITSQNFISSKGIEQLGGYNNIYRNNIVSLAGYAIVLNDFSQGVYVGGNHTIINNTIFSSDRGVNLFNIQDANVLNNTFYNNTADYDNYDMNLALFSSKNILVSGNNFSQIASAGVWIFNSNDTVLSNNIYSCIPMSQRNLYIANDLGSFPAVIQIQPTYKTFLGSTNNDSFTILNISAKESYNVSIQNEVFDSNCGIYVLSQGGQSSISFSKLSRLFSYQFPTYLYSKTDLYLNPLFTNFSRYQVSDGGINDTWRIAYNSNGKVKGFLKIYDDYSYLKNVNLTQTYQYNRYNLSSSLVFNTNGTLYGGGLVTGDVNVTLLPNNEVYVLDNFNLTEGANRENSPLWFSQSSSTTKHIASNLSQAIDATVVIDVSSCEINRIDYTSDTGIFHSYGIPAISCNNNTLQATVTIEDIDPAQSSNVMDIVYTPNLADGLSPPWGLIGLAVFLFGLAGVTTTLYIRHRKSLDDFDNNSSGSGETLGEKVGKLKISEKFDKPPMFETSHTEYSQRVEYDGFGERFKERFRNIFRRDESPSSNSYGGIGYREYSSGSGIEEKTSGFGEKFGNFFSNIGDKINDFHITEKLENFTTSLEERFRDYFSNFGKK